MNETQQLPEEVSDSIFINEVATTFILAAIPFLNAWLGNSFGNVVWVLLVVITSRYCRSLRQEGEKFGPTNPLIVQSYVLSLQKKLVWIRVSVFAAVALFIAHPYGLIYFLVFAGLSVVDLILASSKFGDLKDKESNPQSKAKAASDDRSQ